MDWLRQSTIIDSPELEVYFLLQDKFYIGNPNNSAQYQNDQFWRPITLPSFARKAPLMANTSEAIDHTAELAFYYQSVINYAKQFNKPYHEICHYFWLRLWIIQSEKNIHIGFPWYDSFAEMLHFFTWLKTAPETAYADADQGWDFEAIKRNDKLHIRLSNPDNDEIISNIALPFKPFLDKVMQVESRAQRIIENLTQTVGVDVWSKYLYDLNFAKLK